MFSKPMALAQTHRGWLLLAAVLLALALTVGGAMATAPGRAAAQGNTGPAWAEYFTRLNIPENSASHEWANLSGAASDSTITYAYVGGGADSISVTKNSDGTITVSYDGDALDYETSEGYEYDDGNRQAYGGSIKATDAWGVSNYKDLVIAVSNVDEPPAQVDGLTTAAGSVYAVALSWNTVSDPVHDSPVTGYEIRANGYAYDPDRDIFFTETVSTVSSAVVDMGDGEDREPNAFFWVRAVSQAGKGPWSVKRLGMTASEGNNMAPSFRRERYTMPLAENVVGSDTAQALGTVAAIDVNAHDNISYSLSGDAADPAKFAIDATSGETSYIGWGENHEAHQRPKAAYVFQAVATDRLGRTGTTKVRVNVTDVVEPPPAQAQNLRATATTTEGMTIAWDAVNEAGVDSYRVKYRKASGGDFTRVKVAAPNTSLALTGLEAGVEYLVRVRAHSSTADGPGAWSSKLVHRTYQPPSAPTNLTATVDGIDIHLTWDAPADMGHPGGRPWYEIYKWKRAEPERTLVYMGTAYSNIDDYSGRFRLNDLWYDTEYGFSVAAVTYGAGAGEAAVGYATTD